VFTMGRGQRTELVCLDSEDGMNKPILSREFRFGEDKTIDALIRKYGYRWNYRNDRSGECQCGSRRRSERGCAPHSQIF